MYNALISELEGFIGGEKYRAFSKLQAHLTHDETTIRQMSAHNPNFKNVATASAWQNYLGRDPIEGEKPLRVFGGQNKSQWLLDESQTTGRPLPKVYSNISGDVAYFQILWDCLTGLSSQSVVIVGNYYERQDSISKNGEIIMRPALSQQQQLFALVREIVRSSQTSTIVVEAVSYIVCGHMRFDTSQFSYGYLLKLMGYDVSLKLLKNSEIAEAIISKTMVLIGHLNVALPHLQGALLQSASSGDNSLEERQTSPEVQEAEIVDIKTPATKEWIEKVSEVEFPTWQIFRDFMNIPPDSKVNFKEVRESGYIEENMHPLRESVVKKLFKDVRKYTRFSKATLKA